jgi:hypothetical protein
MEQGEAIFNFLILYCVDPLPLLQGTQRVQMRLDVLALLRTLGFLSVESFFSRNYFWHLGQ